MKATIGTNDLFFGLGIIGTNGFTKFFGPKTIGNFNVFLVRQPLDSMVANYCNGNDPSLWSMKGYFFQHD